MVNVLAVLPLIGMPGLWEWLIIIGIAVFFFGAAKLPQLGKGLGEGFRNFKKGLKGEEEEKNNLPIKTDDQKNSGEPPKNEG